jgi:ubiquinone/menaquinone biosynthesis C-methylase UbiE
MPDQKASPWVRIPAADYESHMAEVGQAAPLREIFRRAYGEIRPRRLLVLGCATGEDFRLVDDDATTRCVGVDLNGDYLEIARTRLSGRRPAVELVQGDCLSVDLPSNEFDLVYAALILEYVDPAALLRRIHGWLAPGGTCVTVTQNPAAGVPPVSRTDHAGLQILEKHMTLHDAGAVADLARAAGLRRTSVRGVGLPGRKSFSVAMFVREGDGRREGG